MWPNNRDYIDSHPRLRKNLFEKYVAHTIEAEQVIALQEIVKRFNKDHGGTHLKSCGAMERFQIMEQDYRLRKLGAGLYTFWHYENIHPLHIVAARPRSQRWRVMEWLLNIEILTADSLCRKTRFHYGNVTKALRELNALKLVRTLKRDNIRMPRYEPTLDALREWEKRQYGIMLS